MLNLPSGWIYWPAHVYYFSHERYTGAWKDSEKVNKSDEHTSIGNNADMSNNSVDPHQKRCNHGENDDVIQDYLTCCCCCLCQHKWFKLHFIVAYHERKIHSLHYMNEARKMLKGPLCQTTNHGEGSLF